MIDARPYVAPDGPRWMPRAQLGSRQTDGRGVEWAVIATRDGGRVLEWETYYPEPGPFDRGVLSYRKARTEITPADPRYPTDEDVAAARRAERKAKRSVT